MRKQNSVFHAEFLSEAGSELENNNYFAFVELDNYACYVLADRLNEQPDIESARLVIETILLAFQEKPSLKRAALYSYLKAANEALLKDKSRKRLKASVVVVVTDYISIRYGCVGNTRLRLYREGALKEKSTLSAPSKARSSWSASSAGLIARPRLSPNCRVAGAGE